MPGTFCPPHLAPRGPFTQECAVTLAPPPSFGVCPSLGMPPLPGLCPITSGAYASFSPEDGGIYPFSSPGFLLLTPLARRTDQALRLEAHGTWWRGSRWWIFFTFWLAHFNVWPFPPLFRSTPSSSRVPSAVGGYDTPAASHRPPCYCTIYGSGLR